jgi:TM2 domain-containing membrane protein YozV
MNMAGPGSGGNVLAAITSFIVPGLGQLFQGRLGAAVAHVVIDAVLWVVTLGWLAWPMHLFSAYDASRNK